MKSCPLAISTDKTVEKAPHQISRPFGEHVAKMWQETRKTRNAFQMLQTIIRAITTDEARTKKSRKP